MKFLPVILNTFLNIHYVRVFSRIQYQMQCKYELRCVRPLFCSSSDGVSVVFIFTFKKKVPQSALKYLLKFLFGQYISPLVKLKRSSGNKMVNPAQNCDILSSFCRMKGILLFLYLQRCITCIKSLVSPFFLLSFFEKKVSRSNLLPFSFQKTIHLKLYYILFFNLGTFSSGIPSKRKLYEYVRLMLQRSNTYFEYSEGN